MRHFVHEQLVYDDWVRPGPRDLSAITYALHAHDIPLGGHLAQRGGFDKAKIIFGESICPLDISDLYLTTRRGAQPAANTPLPEAEQRLALREAALLALAGHDAGLATLRQAMAGRLPPGPLATAFQRLVDTPLQGLADLPRLQGELQIFHRLPTKVEAARQATRGTP